MSTITILEKTYSGEMSYHQMLVKAQAYCPALLYYLCKKFLEMKVKDEALLVQTSEKFSVHSESPEWGYFGSDHKTARICRFLREVFSEQNVDVRGFDPHNNDRRILVDTQFLVWIQSGVVTLDDEKRLVTIS